MSYSSEDKLTFLAYNISELKLEDMAVEGVINIRREHKDGPVVRTVKIGNYKLSSLCAYSPDRLNEAEADLTTNEAMRNSIRVMRGGKEIGYINLEGVFHFTEAPCLYQAVAWGLTTGPGAIMYLEHERVKTIAAELTELARSARQHAHDDVAMAWRREYFLARARTLISKQTYRDDAGRDLPNIFWGVVEKRIFSA